MSFAMPVLFDMFLPDGFPKSVSNDYVPYQIFDSIQALASSFTGTLSTKAILQGVGVGNTGATAAAATLQWVRVCRYSVCKVAPFSNRL